MKPYLEPLLLALAILAGSLTGLFTSFESSQVDFFIIAMLFFLFYNISLDGFLKGIKNRKYLSIALLTNFVAIPILAFLLASIFVDASSAVFIGLIIYLVAPCTDWFLGFTKLAQGDVEINTALLPFNLLAQILLLPVYLFVFTANSVSIPIDAFFDVLIYWVLLPFVIAQVVRFVVSKISEGVFEKSNSLAELAMLLSLILLVFSIFNSNIESLIANTSILPNIFIVILFFFVMTFFLVRIISRAVAFPKKEEVSLTITTAARNAPLMLGISLVLFPQQILIHLVLVIGMLLEFPHLITITYVLKNKAPVKLTTA
ncbi:MAG: bile acid:sodium symporter [Balneolales bacterium]|nr:bile acid:sodium symporter [Balneolales bacterium]